MEDNGFTSLNTHKAEETANIDTGFNSLKALNVEEEIKTTNGDTAFNSLKLEEENKTPNVETGFITIDSDVDTNSTKLDSENISKNVETGFISSNVDTEINSTNIEKENHSIDLELDQKIESLKIETGNEIIPMNSIAIETHKKEDYPPIIYEQNTEMLKKHELNYKYFSITFPERKVKKVVIEMTLKDQGWCTHRNNSGSWVDIEIYKVDGSKKIHGERIIENYGVKEWFNYSVTIDEDHHLFKYLKSKYLIHVVARSDWGWEISVQKGKCLVY